MRVFAALIPPEHVVEDLDEFLSPRRDDPAARALGWSRPDSWHLTLAFMGDAPPDAVDRFIERLADGALDVEVPGLQVRGGGAFPVVESHLGSGGARHVVLDQVPLRLGDED